jgi:hypothetical protein
MRPLFAWVTRDPSCSACTDESVILGFVDDRDSSGQPVWYYKASVPIEQLGFEAHSTLVVLPFVMPAEAWIMASNLCSGTDIYHSSRLANGSYTSILGKLLACTSDSQAAKRQRHSDQNVVNSIIDNFVKSKLISWCAPSGAP